MIIDDHYIWFFWSMAFFVVWIGVYIACRNHRPTMLWASLFTAPFGLTEPLFVPSYWNPPSLFDLAQRTGFDIESIIFSFSIGGLASVFYLVATQRSTGSMPVSEPRQHRHRFHILVLLVPFVVFPLILPLPFNPIYPAIVAMLAGAIATALCRPDLVKKMAFGSVLFLIFYLILLAGLQLSVPGYVAKVWNTAALSGLALAGLPIEEFLFAVAFGAYWSGAYEHIRWRRLNIHKRIGGQNPSSNPPNTQM